MTPELKTLHCPDLDDVSRWTPDGDDVCLWLELSIGLPDQEAADIFQVCVATPSGLKSTFGRSITPRGSAKARPIVLQSYSWAALQKEIRDRLDACAGDDWLEVQENLRRQFDWEYEGYNGAG